MALRLCPVCLVFANSWEIVGLFQAGTRIPLGSASTSNSSSTRPPTTVHSRKTLDQYNCLVFCTSWHANFECRAGALSAGAIVGAAVETYMLERPRVTSQSAGERNYHIFYQLLEGLPSTKLTALGLGTGGPAAFRVLSQVEPPLNPCVSNMDCPCACLTRITSGLWKLARMNPHNGPIQLR